MRLQERTVDPGGGEGHGRGNKETAQSYLPFSVTNVPPEALKNFSHTKRVGNYLLGKTLGEGSFAKVKEGMHSLTGEKVAVKVIDKKKAREDAYVRKNLRREGKLLQMVHHRHVVRLFEIMETENSYYLVTELCKGGDLMEHICNKKRLDEKETRKYVRQILSAVDYLHKAGILHRDLKVENLLLDENQDVKIIDFGLSNAVEVSRGSSGATIFHEFCVTQCGSPAYAAPELLGNNKYGPSVDIWSIGVNMFAMLTGSLPFTVEPFNIKALHKKMQKGDMNSIPDHLTHNCRDLVKRFLNPDPESRITIQEAMRHPWICDSYMGPVEPALFPNKLTQEDLVADIVKHMNQQLDLKANEIVRLVIGNIPNSATATYFMFAQRLKRHEAETQLQARIKKASKMAQRHMNSNIDLTGNDVIELTPIKHREENNNQSSRVPGGPHRSQEARVIDMNLSPRRIPKEADEKPTQRKHRHDNHETTATRGGKNGHQDSSPRRAAHGARRGSMDHSPRQSPRHSPRRTHPNRRGSLEPPRRGSLLPRSLSQETEGSSVAPSDIVLPELDAEPEDTSVGQPMLSPMEGVKGHDRTNPPRPPMRHRPGLHPPNLPSLNAFNTRSPMEQSPTPSPSPRPKALTHLSPPRDGEKYLAGRLTDRNNNKDNGRLSPCLNCSGNSPQRIGMELDNRKAHVCSSHSTASSVGRLSSTSNTVGGGGGRGGALFPRPEDSHSGQSVKGEWRNVKPANNNRGNNHLVANNNDIYNSDTVNGKMQDSMGKKLVIDTGHYDRYARASGRIRTVAHPANSRPDPDNVYQAGQKRLINLMYPSQKNRPRHSVPKNSQYIRTGVQTTNNQSSYPHHGEESPRNNYVNAGDNYLGVTGERASGRSSGRLGSGVKRQHINQNQFAPSNSLQAERGSIMPVGGNYHRPVSPANVGRSRSPSPSYFRGSNNGDKVALPAISPTLGLSSGRIHIEDLDRQ